MFLLFLCAAARTAGLDPLPAVTGPVVNGISLEGQLVTTTAFDGLLAHAASSYSNNPAISFEFFFALLI